MAVPNRRSTDAMAAAMAPSGDASPFVEDELVAAFREVAAMLAEQQQRIEELASADARRDGR